MFRVSAMIFPAALLIISLCASTVRPPGRPLLVRSRLRDSGRKPHAAAGRSGALRLSDGGTVLPGVSFTGVHHHGLLRACAPARLCVERDLPFFEVFAAALVSA